VATYRRPAGRGIAPLADLYLPRDPSGASVVLVHGGGFVIGSRRMRPMRYLAARLVAARVAVCAVDYRLIFRGGRLGEAIDDVADALAFWHAEAARRGLDSRAVSLVGLSAGASLALYAAARDAARVHRLVCCFGLYDLDLPDPASLLPRLLLRTPDRAVWRARSPLRAPQPPAPTLLLHGSADRLVPVAQARRLAAARDALGLPTRLVVYPGAPHAFFTGPHRVADTAFADLLDHLHA
jgi:acetyl esterase/lipase